MTATTEAHGYSAYTCGCRCDTCKAAKRAYMASRRQQALSAPADKSAEDFTHGTRFGYEERGCRCDECTEAKRASWRQGAFAWNRHKHPDWRCSVCGYRYARCRCPAPLAGAS